MWLVLLAILARFILASPDQQEGGIQREVYDMTFQHEAPLSGRRCRDVLDGWEILQDVGPVEYLRACGVVQIRKALRPDMLESMYEAFLKLEASSRAKLYEHAPLREQRQQYMLPCEAPFCDRAVFADQRILDLVGTYLGPGFVLDLVTVVVVGAKAANQDNHRDVQISGSLAVQVALHPLHRYFAPLTLCAGTHNMTDGDWKATRQSTLRISEKMNVKEAFQKALCKDLIVASPMDAGDIAIYDSKLFHWGSSNHEAVPRYALYLNYKNSTAHPGVHPNFDEALGNEERRVAMQGFYRMFSLGRETGCSSQILPGGPDTCKTQVH